MKKNKKYKKSNKTEKAKGLTDDQLSSLVMSYYEESINGEDILQKQRKDTLSRYRREKYGDEDPNWSQVITSDVRDTIAWFLPVLLEVYFGPVFPAKFSARSEEDIKQAQLETDYTLNVINQQNNGFLMMYIWLKDALVQKNGYVHAYFDENVEREQEDYEGLTDQEYQVLLVDPDIEIKEHTILINGEEYDEDEYEENASLLQGLGQEIEVLHEVVVVRMEDNSQIKIDNLPPESVFVDGTHTSVDLTDCPCTGFETEVTRSDLIVDGYDKKMVMNLPTATDVEDTQEKHERDRLDLDNQDKIDKARSIDKSREKVRIVQAYIRCDKDGDGRTELNFVKLAGPNGEHVLECTPVSSVRIYCCTPEVEPHEHFGTSIAELVEDLQRIRTVMTRQMLNNLYLVNHPQTEYVSGAVDYNDLITRAPGSTIKVKAPNMVNTITTPFTAGATLPMFEELTRRTEARTGISETTQGLNAESLSLATNLVGTKILNAAQARIMLVARLILETGFKGLFRGVHELASQHDRKKMIELNGEFQEVNPRLWRKRSNLIVEMGPGHADASSKLLALQTVIMTQEKAFAAQGGDGPLVGLEHIHNAVSDMTKLSGISDSKKYFRDPATYQAPPKEPDTVDQALEIEKMRTKTKVIMEDKKLDFEREKHEDEMALKEFQVVEELAMKGSSDDTEREERAKRADKALRGDGSSQGNTEQRSSVQGSSPNPERNIPEGIGGNIS